MDWEALARHRAVVEWRDTYMLEAMYLLGRRCREGLDAFESQLSQAGVLDTIWDPDAFATPRIDALLLYLVPSQIAQLFDDAAAALCGIDPQFEPIAQALRESASIPFPEEVTKQTLPAVISEMPADATPPASRWIDYLPAAVRDKAADLSRILSDATLPLDRPREAAARRISTHWMAETGEPRPILAQVLTIIDDMALEARMTME